MKKFLILALALLMPLVSYAKPLSTDEQWLLNNSMGPVASQVTLGDLIDGSKALVRAIYDTSVAGLGSSVTASGAHTLGVALPANAVIMRSWYQVLDPLKSDGNGSNGKQAQLALHCETAANIKAAGNGSAINVLGTITSGVSDNIISNFQKITNRCLVTADVTVDNFTRGKLAVFVEYYMAHQ